jgi:hypothetical protein
MMASGRRSGQNAASRPTCLPPSDATIGMPHAVRRLAGPRGRGPHNDAVPAVSRADTGGTDEGPRNHQSDGGPVRASRRDLNDHDGTARRAPRQRRTFLEIAGRRCAGSTATSKAAPLTDSRGSRGGRPGPSASLRAVISVPAYLRMYRRDGQFRTLNSRISPVVAVVSTSRSLTPPRRVRLGDQRVAQLAESRLLVSLIYDRSPDAAPMVCQR